MSSCSAASLFRMRLQLVCAATWRPHVQLVGYIHHLTYVDEEKQGLNHSLDVHQTKQEEFWMSGNYYIFSVLGSHRSTSI